MPETEVELASLASVADGKPSGGRTSTNGVHLRAGRASYNLLGLEPDEYPMLPRVAEATRMTLERVALHDAIKQVIFAAANDDARPVLTGVLLTCKEGHLRLVATDTHRLAVRECGVVSVSGADFNAVIPVRAISEIGRLISGEVGEAEPGDRQVILTFSENQVQFEMRDSKTGASTTLISRLIEGQFPSYERVVPQSWERKLNIERESFLAAVKRASIVARAEGSANRLVLRIEGEGSSSKLTLTATNGNLGNAFEEIDIAKEGADAPLDIAFNAKYLQDVLNVLDGDGLYLELTEPLRPGIVRPAEDSSYFCVLMPMQVV
jgi:DNA polymerase-3 subunit beta